MSGRRTTWAALAAGLALAACGESEPQMLGGPIAIEREAAPAEPPPEPAAPRDRAEAAARRMEAAWAGEPLFTTQWNALDPTLPLDRVATADLFDPADPYWGLPRTEGYGEVAFACAGCHSFRLVMQQTVSAARWDAMIDWMVDEQGMPPLEPGERETVVAYLARHFGDAPS